MSEWRAITIEEYHRLMHARGPFTVGATNSDPDGDRGRGEPHMLTTWDGPDGEPKLRHQCWPIGHVTGFSRPCLYETTIEATDDLA